MRKGIAFALLAVALLSAWFAYSKVMQARREATYRVAIAPFQRDLHDGTPRLEVENYLRARNAQYNAIDFGQTYLIEIAEEPPGNLWCEPWQVYIALEFGPSDILKDVHIRKLGTCL
jgi:hypothetical protein